MVNRNPVTGVGSARGGTQQVDRPVTADNPSAQVIPLHAPEKEQRVRGTTGSAKCPVAPDEHGDRADAEVVRLPGTARQDEPPPGGPSAAPVRTESPYDDLLPAAAVKALDFVRGRLTGDYNVDEYGFDAEFTEIVLLPALRVLYDKWFRVTAHGVDNLPPGGGGLVVCNHSGTVPLDAMMTSLAVHDAHPKQRHLRLLAADLLFEVPFLSMLARKAGHTLACNADAERLLRHGELVGVFPEGFKGIGKPYSARYKLQRFGRGGFVSAAMRTGVPIIPCAIVGAEEIYPKIGDLKPLARLLGLPYFPVTPFFPLLGPLGAIPLPTKWHIEFGEPIPTDGIDGDSDDPLLMFDLTDRVREAVQQMLYERLSQRRGIFSD
ncbi:MAG: hypothetical protein GEU86_04820 [Actinophytocola sp.]|nr:hypothetical protein [Actinophytocola sp.]